MTKEPHSKTTIIPNTVSQLNRSMNNPQYLGREFMNNLQLRLDYLLVGLLTWLTRPLPPFD